MDFLIFDGEVYPGFKKTKVIIDNRFKGGNLFYDNKKDIYKCNKKTFESLALNFEISGNYEKGLPVNCRCAIIE